MTGENTKRKKFENILAVICDAWPLCVACGTFRPCREKEVEKAAVHAASCGSLVHAVHVKLFGGENGVLCCHARRTPPHLNGWAAAFSWLESNAGE